MAKDSAALRAYKDSCWIIHAFSFQNVYYNAFLLIFKRL